MKLINFKKIYNSYYMFIEYKIIILLLILYINFYTNKQGIKFYNDRNINKKTNQKVYDICLTIYSYTVIHTQNKRAIY